jgi:hypothetical protein
VSWLHREHRAGRTPRSWLDRPPGGDELDDDLGDAAGRSGRFGGVGGRVDSAGVDEPSIAVAGSASVAASVAVAGSNAVVGSVAVAGSNAVAGSVAVAGSALTILGAGIRACVATVLCVRCRRCVACIGCVDCVGCVGCIGCVGLRGAVGARGVTAA